MKRVENALNFGPKCGNRTTSLMSENAKYKYSFGSSYFELRLTHRHRNIHETQINDRTNRRLKEIVNDSFLCVTKR